MEKEEFLSLYRHSLAHVLAKAVIEIFGKDVQYAIGPQIADGAYYDFVLPRPASPEDFTAIEDKMREILKRPGRERKSQRMKLWIFLRIRNIRKR